MGVSERAWFSVMRSTAGRVMRWMVVAWIVGWATAFVLWLPWMLTYSKAAADLVQPSRNLNPNESMHPSEYWGWIWGLYSPNAHAIAIAVFVMIVMVKWLIPQTWSTWRGRRDPRMQ